MKLNLNKNQKYILACSNGPDSMALFDLLLKNNYFFIVCFVNYKTRIESDIEEENLRLICNKNNIKLETLTYNLKDKKSDFENIFSLSKEMRKGDNEKIGIIRKAFRYFYKLFSPAL